MEFGTSGYTMDHVFVLYDRATDSVWYPGDDATLQAVAGESKGAAVPFLDEPAPVMLADWLEQQPGSTVLLPTERDFKLLNRPYLGVGLDDQDGRVVVDRVREESPAALAGFEVGDVLRKIGKSRIDSRRDLREALLELEAGETVKMIVEREGRKVVLRPTLAAR